MRVCIVASQETLTDVSQFLGDVPSELVKQNTRHTFHVRLVDKLNFREQISTAAAEGFDFYFVHVWDSSTSDVEALQYLESLGLPFCGVYSHDGFVAVQDNGSSPQGLALSCHIIQAGDGCFALPPVVVGPRDIKLDSTSPMSDDHDDGTILQKMDDLAVFEHVQKTAIDHYLARGYKKGNMGCTVDLVVHPDGNVSITRTDPRPGVFQGTDRHQQSIMQSLPGGHRAMIDIFIANQLSRRGSSVETLGKLSDQYSQGAVNYEAVLSDSQVPKTMERIADMFDFGGTVFDLACGTGIFGRALKGKQSVALTGKCQLLGFDIAPGMLKICESFRVYDQVHVDSMEETLLHMRRYADRVDHVVCFTATMFLQPEMFTMFLVLAFALTDKSVTFTVVDIPDTYNDWLAGSGYEHMYSTNHVKTLEEFGTPPGWSLRWSHREFAWSNPMSGHDIYSTIYRFEREGTRNIIYRSLPEITS